MSAPRAAVAPDVAAGLVAEASLAPSVHNVQPARWRVTPTDGGARVELLRDPARALPVADASGHDVRVSLGAALEGFALAASARGLAVDEVRWEPWAPAAAAARALVPAATARLRPARADESADPLAAHVRARRCWRGPFRQGEASRAADATAVAGLAGDGEDGGAVHVLPPADAAGVARDADDATWAFERREDYHEELWRWLRLDPGAPEYRRDGLTADALVLSPLERRAASLLLRPRVFRWLQRTGLGRPVVSEAAATRTAAGLVLLAVPGALAPERAGRFLYRAWLRAAAAGIVLAPMSALVDHAPSAARLGRRVGLGADERLLMVFRAGRLPDGVDAPPPSPRLPVGELLLGPGG